MRLPELDPIRPSLEKQVVVLAERIGASAVCLHLFTENYKKGIDSLLQFSLAMMLDKPIYLLAPEGTTIPENVRKVALGIEFFDPNDKASMARAVDRFGFLAAGKAFGA